MEALNERIAHSVRLQRRFSPPIYEVNCFMFALGIEAGAVSDMRLGPVFPGKQFVESLLANGDLREVEGEGPISSIVPLSSRDTVRIMTFRLALRRDRCLSLTAQVAPENWQ